MATKGGWTYDYSLVITKTERPKQIWGIIFLYLVNKPESK